MDVEYSLVCDEQLDAIHEVYNLIFDEIERYLPKEIPLSIDNFK